MIRNKCDVGCGAAVAYREGLGLAAVVLGRTQTGIRIRAVTSAQVDPSAAEDDIEARWWCRAVTDAERIAAAASARLRRRESSAKADNKADSNADNTANDSSALSFACDAVGAAAENLAIVLQSDREIADAAMRVVARIEAELQSRQRSGELKSVNKAYRAYRIEASGRGERVLRYDEWMRKYKENLVRQVAAALRGI